MLSLIHPSIHPLIVVPGHGGARAYPSGFQAKGGLQPQLVVVRRRAHAVTKWKSISCFQHTSQASVPLDHVQYSKAFFTEKNDHE